jgi:hypothetical protein
LPGQFGFEAFPRCAGPFVLRHHETAAGQAVHIDEEFESNSDIDQVDAAVRLDAGRPR